MTKQSQNSADDLPTRGRPSRYTEDIADRICEEISGGRSLLAICGEAGMPKPATVFRWLANERYSTFRDMYARAREAQADALFDEILEIADTPLIGERVKSDDGRTEVTREDMLGHRKLQVDTRKWVAAKLAPRKYGDRLELDHRGQLPPLVETMTQDQMRNILEDRVGELVAAAARAAAGDAKTKH